MKMFTYMIAFILSLTVANGAQSDTNKDPLYKDYIKLMTSTVKVATSSQSHGTGFFVKGKSGKLYIMTNSHVCGKFKEFLITYNKKVKKARLVVRDRQTDLCLLTTPFKGRPIKIAKKARLFEKIIAIGYPNGELTGQEGRIAQRYEVMLPVTGITKAQCKGKYLKVKVDVINKNTAFEQSFERCVRVYIAIKTTMLVFPGFSGGAAINVKGKLIGVVTMTDYSQAGAGSLGLIKYVKDLLKKH